MNNITQEQYNIITNICKKLTNCLFLDDLIQEVAIVIMNLDKSTYNDIKDCKGKYIKFVNSVSYLMFIGRSTFNKKVYSNFDKNKCIFNKDYQIELDLHADNTKESLISRFTKFIDLGVFDSKDMLFIKALIKNDWKVSDASKDTGVSESAFYYRLNKIKQKIKDYDSY